MAAGPKGGFSPQPAIQQAAGDAIKALAFAERTLETLPSVLSH